MDLIFIIYLLLLHSVLGKQAVQLVEYHAVGSNVTLRTEYEGNDLTSADWKHDGDNAVNLYENITTPYRNFKGSLNYTNGDLTLMNVTESMSGAYTVSLNGKDRDTKYIIKVIDLVPVPEVTVYCSSEGELMRFCLYTCAGDTSQSEPVSYKWSYPNRTSLLASDKTIKVTMSLTGPPDQFFCTMKNSVSTATSLPTTTTAPPTATAPSTATAPPSPSAEWKNYVSTLILAVILAAIFLALIVFFGVHRHKTGVWFWNKEIWKKQKDKTNESPKDGSPQPLLNQN